VTFIRTNLTHRSLSADEGLAVLFSLLDTGVAVDLGFVRDETSVFHYGSSNGTFA
jgi:hypothetical protein